MPPSRSAIRQQLRSRMPTSTAPTLMVRSTKAARLETASAYDHSWPSAPTCPRVHRASQEHKLTLRPANYLLCRVLSQNTTRQLQSGQVSANVWLDSGELHDWYSETRSLLPLIHLNEAFRCHGFNHMIMPYRSCSSRRFRLSKQMCLLHKNCKRSYHESRVTTFSVGPLQRDRYSR